MGAHLKINSGKLAVFGTIWTPVKDLWTPVKDFLTPPLQGASLLKGGGHAPLSE